MATERSESCSESNKPPTRRVDARISTICGNQHQLITLAQLRAAGLDRSQVHRRVRAGRLHRLHRGVYSLISEPATLEARLLAAVLGCGRDAALSFRSSLVLWRVCEPRPGPIDVTVPGRSGRSDRRIRIHRSDLPPADRTRRHGIPTTTPPRALIDFAAVAGERELERALSEARFLQLIDPAAFAARIEGLRGRRGVRALRRLLAAGGPPTRTRSELEERMLALIREAGLPEPLVNHRVETAAGPLEVDFCWPAQRLIIETDGRAAHADPARFEADRRRDQLLGAAGWRVHRFTWHQADDEPGLSAATIAALLRIGEASSTLSRRAKRHLEGWQSG